MLFILPFLLAMALTMAGLPILSRAAVRWRFIDPPGGRKVHAVPIPRIGGIAMTIGVLIAACMVIPLDRSDRYFLAAAGIVAVFGCLDDRLDLDYRLKLLGQLLATFVVMAGGVQIHALTLDDHVLIPPWLAMPLTALFLVGITNAINLADGLDGLAGGTTFLSLCALAMLAYSGGQMSSAALALTFAGAVLGFLRFNTFPASIFMGDAGSQLLGFAVGVLSLRATQINTTAVSAATPLLLLALPILDTLSVMTQRISEGRSPFSPDKNHIHHKLLAFGFHHHEAVMVIYAVQADLFLLAYWLRYESDALILTVVSIFFAGSILFLHIAARRGLRFRHRDAAADSRLSRFIAAMLEPKYLSRWSYLAVATALASYAALVMSESRVLANDIRWLLIAMFVVALLWLCFFRIRPLSIIEKGGLYVTVAILVYLDTALLNAAPLLSVANWAAIMIAAAGALLHLRLAEERRFELTPLDIIVLFVALVVPNLAASIGLPHGGALGIAKLVILFYALEVLVSRLDMPVVVLRLSVATVLAALIIRPML
jgi:UDP-GlcNAc:undecaprenyl-phosphate GlcNAc-1-phosphate transferase